MKKYLALCLLSAATVAALAASVNWLVDPYWFFGAPAIKRFNTEKASLSANTRVFKTITLLRNRPQALILGTSREDAGIDPQHRAFAGYRVFNAAMPGQRYVESNLFLRALAERGSAPDLIVFGLLFENIYTPAMPADFSTDNFSDERRFSLLFNLNTLKESAITVTSNLIGVPDAARYRRDGFRLPIAWRDELKVGQRRAFQASDQSALAGICRRDPSLEAQRIGRLTPMAELREAIALAYQSKTDMRIFIGPSHARQWETTYARGRWGQFEDWKRMVLAVIESEAKRAQAAPFALWDFSGYNAITEEDVAPARDVKARMRYYYESSHYKPATGDLVLDRMFDLRTPDRALPADFGVRLNSANINAHLANQRVARERYRQSHPEDVAEIEAMARDAARRCRSAG